MVINQVSKMLSCDFVPREEDFNTRTVFASEQCELQLPIHLLHLLQKSLDWS